MTRQNLVIFSAAALAILYVYMIFDSYSGNRAINSLHLLGLGLAVGLLVIQVRPLMKK